MYHDILLHGVLDILRDRLLVPSERLTPLNYDKPLTGFEMKLDVTEMIYLYMEICKKYQIRIAPDHLRNYGFNSINAIVSTLEEYQIKTV